jgi:hypothetical protein
LKVCVLFIIFLNSIPIGVSVFPLSFVGINIFMSQSSDSVHGRVFNRTFVICAIRKYYGCIVIIGLSIFKLSLVICPILKDSDSISFRQSIWIKLTLIIGFFWLDIEKRFSL